MVSFVPTLYSFSRLQNLSRGPLPVYQIKRTAFLLFQDGVLCSYSLTISSGIYVYIQIARESLRDHDSFFILKQPGFTHVREFLPYPKGRHQPLKRTFVFHIEQDSYRQEILREFRGQPPIVNQDRRIYITRKSGFQKALICITRWFL